MERKPKKEGLLERTAQALDLPGEVVGLPRVEIVGRQELRMENHRGILAYGAEEILVSGGKLIIKVRGTRPGAEGHERRGAAHHRDAARGGTGREGAADGDELVNLLRGSVRLEVTGAFPERFLNLCAQRGVAFWGVEWPEEPLLRLTVAWQDRKGLEDLARRTGCTLDEAGQRRGAALSAAVSETVCPAHWAGPGADGGVRALPVCAGDGGGGERDGARSGHPHRAAAGGPAPRRLRPGAVRPGHLQ